jgi:nicotinamide riboside transporter PnuC
MMRKLLILIIVVMVMGCESPNWFNRLGHKSKSEEVKKKQIPPPRPNVQWLIPICLIGLGLSVIAASANMKLGVMLAGGCGGTMLATILIDRFYTQLAVAALIMVLAALAAVGWMLWTRSKGLREVVQSYEQVKGFVPMKDWDSLGKNVEKIQSKITEKLVRCEQKKLKQKESR